MRGTNVRAREFLLYLAHNLSSSQDARGDKDCSSWKLVQFQTCVFLNNNNNNHLDFWDIPFQPREEFSRRGLLPPILGGIFNLVILRTPALPNPRYPALPRQDTSYTWTLADRCYQLWLHSR